MNLITWPYTLRRGHTSDPSKGACVMDAINWLVHSRHGDEPECACRVITPFVIPGNDSMPDNVRQRFLPYLHRIAGSRSPAHERARSRVLWLGAVRVFVPRALDAAGLHEEASALRELPDDVTPEMAKATAHAAAVIAAHRTASLAIVTKAGRKTRAKEEAARMAAAAAAWAEEAVSWSTLAAAAAARTARATTETARAAATAATRAAKAQIAVVALADRATTETAILAAEGRSARAAAIASAIVAAWDDYFAVLDEALNAGPQGEPWSADVVERQVALFDAAVR